MRSAFLFAVAVAAGAVAAPVPKDFKKPEFNFHPLSVGDKREFVSPNDPETVTQVRAITGVEEKGGARYYTQSLTNSKIISVLKTDATGTVWMTEQNGAKFDKPYTVVKADMKEGDKWEMTDGTGGLRTVGKPEKITVPAGTYTAFPIRVSYPNNPNMGEVTVWYADGVGLVRLDSGGVTSLVLKKYTPGKDAK